MPPGRKQQNNVMLYTLITFVGLFIIAATFAVIFYVKFEEQAKIAQKAEADLGEIASAKEVRSIGKIVGKKERRQSYMTKMTEALDSMVYMIIGGVPEDTTAEVKTDTAKREVGQTLDFLAQNYADFEQLDPNTTGLIPVIGKLQAILQNTSNAQLAAENQLTQLQNRFNDAIAASFEKEQKLEAEKDSYQQQITDIAEDYKQLKTLVEQTSEQRVQTLLAQLEQGKNRLKKEHQQKLQLEAKYEMSEDMMKQTLQQLRSIKPPPDIEVAAFESDGQIMMIDNQHKIVHLNIGSNDGVYRGLIFAVYDRSVPIPKDGKGKAEVEVFKVEKNVSAARITRSEKKRPIIKDDIIANLIWDSKKTNTFVIAGNFDLNNDGSIEFDAIDKLKKLIKKQLGTVAGTVSIETDFLILGTAPKTMKRPSFEEMEIYPLAMEKYQASIEKRSEYTEMLNKAQALSIPIFNYERFLYFIGYKSQANKPGAF